MPRPDLALAAIRRSLRPDGVLVIKDIKSTGDFEKDRRNPLLALMYGFSVSACLGSGLSTEDGLGLGTLGFHPEVAEGMCRSAGFSRFRIARRPRPRQSLLRSPSLIGAALLGCGRDNRSAETRKRFCNGVRGSASTTQLSSRSALVGLPPSRRNAEAFL